MDECCIAAAVLAPQYAEIKENLIAAKFNRLKLSARLRAFKAVYRATAGSCQILPSVAQSARAQTAAVRRSRDTGGRYR
jgi:hypothetical protein